MNEKKCSIVMTYYNRWEQLKSTLESFQRKGYSNYEIIIVDDASTQQPLCKELLDRFNLPIKLITMPGGKEKYYSNPCIPFNAGFKAATGDIVIIQNAECYHYCDVLSVARKKTEARSYITFGCFSVDKSNTELLYQNFNHQEEIIKLSKNYGVVKKDGELGWYNHSIHRSQAYHFTSCINRDDLADLGGFDERYALGSAYDDDEFIYRIRKNNLKVIIDDENIVFHQWHYTNPAPKATYKNFRNLYLFNNVTTKEKEYGEISGLKLGLKFFWSKALWLFKGDTLIGSMLARIISSLKLVVKTVIKSKSTDH